jgi:LPXTG-motif cell wall-anchored protein
MVNRNVLIGKVSPFTGKREIVVANQDTVDIIDALIKNHYKYSNEYDKIFRYFDGGSVEETAFNVWQFLKDDFKYTIEPEKMQILRSPAAILASNVIGIDCKGYATFVNGIMDAYRRNTKKDFDVFYRFASYDPFDSTPQHVFAVVNENGVEYWIDPVLDQFDERKQPYYFKDKKIKNMALVAMSGIPAISGTKTNTMGNWFNDLLKASPDIIKSFTPTGGGMQPSGGYGGGYYPVQYQQPSTGMNQNTMLILGAAGILAVILLTKKR